MLLCRGATVYAASIAMPNIRGFRCGANLFAIAMASRRCVGRKEHLYLQIEYGQATECCSAEALQYMRQAKRSRIYVEIQASEPERNSNKPPQHIEKFSITRIQQAHSLVQMQRQREASEPCIKAKSNRQPTHNKRIARLSATAPEVQIPSRAGMPRNANVSRMCFWQGYSRKGQQSSPGI